MKTTNRNATRTTKPAESYLDNDYTIAEDVADACIWWSMLSLLFSLLSD